MSQGTSGPHSSINWRNHCKRSERDLTINVLTVVIFSLPSDLPMIKPESEMISFHTLNNLSETIFVSDSIVKMFGVAVEVCRRVIKVGQVATSIG